MYRRIDVGELRWNAWNQEHIAKHEVTRQQVEEVFQGEPIYVGSYAGRYVAIGPISTGRVLAVVIRPVTGTEGTYYPISARPASRKERRYYEDVTWRVSDGSA